MQRKSSNESWITDSNEKSTERLGEPMFRRLKRDDGTLYEGEVDRNFQPDGKGWLRTSTGDLLRGQWKRGLLMGNCQIQQSSGVIYEGEIHKNLRNGYGRLLCGNASVISYEGTWSNDLPNGRGRYSNEEDGISYEGEWRNGHANGYGVLKMNDWGHYEGTFRDDLRHGSGKVHYANGSSYEGDWVDDMAEGHGVYRWPDGSVYEGEFVNGTITGLGTLETPSYKFSGSWERNQRRGYGRIVFSDGAVYEGDWSNDRPEGEGDFINPYGVLFRGKWRNGRWCSAENAQPTDGLITCVIESGNYTIRGNQPPHCIQPSLAPGQPHTLRDIPDPLVALRMGTVGSSLNNYSLHTGPYQSVVRPEGGDRINTGYIYHTAFNTEVWIEGENDEDDEKRLTTDTILEDLLPESPIEEEQVAAAAAGGKGYANRFEETHTLVFPDGSVESPPRRDYGDQNVEATSREGQSSIVSPTAATTRSGKHFKAGSETQSKGVDTLPEKYTPIPATTITSYSNVTEPCAPGEEVVVLSRNVPIPVEAISTVEFRLPRLRVRNRRIDIPVYVPRLIEVPVPVENLSEQGLRLCDEIAMSVERLAQEGASQHLTGGQYDDLARDLERQIHRGEQFEGSHAHPIPIQSISNFLPPNLTKIMSSGKK